MSRARISQIMNLRLLAPDIQEAMLHLPRTECGRAVIREHVLSPAWAVLRRPQAPGRMWDHLVGSRARSCSVEA